MPRVGEILALLLALGLRLLDRVDAERAADFRDSVLADAGAQWVRDMGGTDARDRAGKALDSPADTGGHRD